ncbi:MAG: tRNA(Ile)-lysidine synthase [Bacillota bacterium]|nr:MAG: tRNA(Ile)-lysidine synthase [Bacillota bacterium]MBS3949612.1 tRNA lysidine(34) synthetase TilS [Peptococcaceae bacterium]
MLDCVRKYCREYNLLPQGAKILVGVSGGPDSVALLFALHSLADCFGVSLYAAHLNHGFRGQEATGDATFVQELCLRLNIPCTVGFADVPGLIESTGGSPQAVAREARFRFLRQVSEQHDCDLLALGHHLDDQAETVLLNIVRGSGVEGLSAMLPQSTGLCDLRIIRPLLNQKRSVIENYLATLGENYRIDSSNLKEDYSRNFVRRKVMPQLYALNPKVAESIIRLAQAAACDDAYLSSEVTEVWPIAVTESTDGMRIRVEALSSLHVAISSRLIRRVWQQDSSLELSYQHVMAILGLCGKQTGKRIALPGGNLALRSGGSIILMRACSTDPYMLGLTIPGTAVIAGIGTLSAEPLYHLPPDILREGSPFTAYLNADVQALDVRTRVPGDRYWPLGAPGSKKLKEVMSEAQIPAPLRDCWPVLCAGRDIVWVPGVRISELYRVKEMDRVIKLRFIRGGN